jgi:hypothetical protein
MRGKNAIELHDNGRITIGPNNIDWPTSTFRHTILLVVLEGVGLGASNFSCFSLRMRWDTRKQKLGVILESF